MATLTAIKFDTPDGADRLEAALEDLQQQGLIVVQDAATGLRASHRVSLMSTQQVLELRDRYLDVSSGKGAPAMAARSDKQCASCGHRSVCATATVDRIVATRKGA